jgi:hypothetical protein
LGLVFVFFQCVLECRNWTQQIHCWCQIVTKSHQVVTTHLSSYLWNFVHSNSSQHYSLFHVLELSPVPQWIKHLSQQLQNWLPKLHSLKHTNQLMW